MNWDIIKGKWNQIQGAVKQEWGDLTDDDLTHIEGDRDRMAGKLQERYGWAKTEVDDRMDAFFRRHL